MLTRIVAIFLPLVFCSPSLIQAQQEADVSSQINIPLPTLGGAQLWTDYRNREGFRVQQHAATGHWRLLNKRDIRIAWGTKKQCLAELENVKPKAKLKANDHVVVLLHGLMRTGRSMKPFDDALQNAEFKNTVRFSYASSRRSIDNHAQALQELIEDWPGSSRLSFVGHSMGNIVVRRMLGELGSADPQGILLRSESMVMLGPPNQGAAIARRLAPTGLYGLIAGKGGMQLGKEWQDFERKLATPRFPFMIFAGDVSDNKLQNPLIDSGNDYLVTVEEAKLKGAAQFEVVPVMHTLLMNDGNVHKKSLEFMKNANSPK